MGTILSRVVSPLAFTLTVSTLLVAPLQAQQTISPSAAAIRAIRVAGSTAEEVENVGIRPGDRMWLDMKQLPGVKIQYLLADQVHDMNPYTYRLKFPAAGYALQAHTSKTSRYVTVLEGTYVVGFGETADRSKAVAFPAGSYIWLPRYMPHFSWTEGETVIQVHGNGSDRMTWIRRQ